MKLSINGEVKQFQESSMTVYALLSSLNIKPEFVAVELNGDIVLSENFQKTVLGEDDTVEIVSFVGGG